MINSRVVKIIKNKKLVPSFDPSMKVLMRLMKFMLENNSKGRTQLALDTHLNYTRLAKHVVWLETRGLIELTLVDTKVLVVLTPSGRKFASVISQIE